jgi:site-specific recombinase XerD
MADKNRPALFPDQLHSPTEVVQNGFQGQFWSSPSGQDGSAFYVAPLELFLQSLVARNVSPLTIRAYGTDVRQFVTALSSTNPFLSNVEEVTPDDVTEHLAQLAKEGRSGVTRARKLAAIREFFKFLVDNRMLEHSPAEKVAIPKKEKKARVYLRPDEYARMLSAAGGNPRDFAILQLFLQTGIRVSELCTLTLTHLDLQARTLTVDGKGGEQRVIDLEKKAVQALVNYLRVRPNILDDHLFLNYEGVGISDRGVKKIVEKYRQAAGITKQISAHSLRHTFGTYKAQKGISAFQVKEWLGHASVTTTQIYVHLGREEAKKAMEATSL